MIIEVLRHAKALGRRRWGDAPDRDRPLDPTGLTQAAALAEVFAVHRPDRLITSPLTRCVQTVQPIAAATGATIEVEASLAELRTLPAHDRGSPWVASAWLAGRGLELIDGIVADPRLERVVLCSHGDVISALLAALVGRDGLDLPDVHVRKGGRVTLTVTNGRVGAALPVPPPAG